MALDLQSAAPPLEASPDGTVRVTGTRITLDTIVREYDAGASAEDLVLRYPTLDLADAYAVIAYVLRQRPAVDSYLSERASKEQASIAAIPAEMSRIRLRLDQLRDIRS